MASSKKIHPAGPIRRDRRYPQLSELSIVYEGSSERITIRPPDISLRGMFINTPRRFPEGAVLTVRFRLAYSGHEVEARSEVRYCLPGVGIGVEFLEMSPESQQYIVEELKRWEAYLNETTVAPEVRT